MDCVSLDLDFFSYLDWGQVVYIYIFFYIRQPRRNQTLWDKSEVKRWEHDRYVEAEQGPKEEWEKMVIPAVRMFSFILSLCQH